MQNDDDRRGAGLSLRLDEAQGGLVATVSPVADAAPIDEAWLQQHIAEAGYAALRYLPTAATILLSRYNAGTAVGALKIAECVDATLHLEISPDGLEALLDISPAQGGKPVTRVEVFEALAAKDVSDGIDMDAINRAIAEGAASRLVVARGLPPEHGKDGWLEKVLVEARDRQPHVDEGGRIDYRDLGDVVVVHPGDRLMKRHPPTAGAAGRTLLGQPIAARPGQDVMFSAALSGVGYLPEDPNVLIASITGQPVTVPGGMMVEPVFSVGEVGTASGNIKFDGSVVIKGDVMAGMTVSATGDIEVGGMVEAATLEAGGAIVIKGGVVGGLGRKETAIHVLRCGASFNAAYVQQARIEAGDSIFIDDTAMQCELVAANYIVIGDKKRGNLIGGKAQATLSITAKVLGSPNRVSTLIEIGVSPAMHKQLLEMAKVRDGKETQLLEISKLMEFARQHPGRLPAEKLQLARSTAAALSADIAALREEHAVLTKKVELSLESRVTATQAMYDGVEVHMGTQRYRVVGEHGAGSIGLGKSGLGLVADDGER